MSLKDLEQFRQKEPTPEPVSAQAEAKAAQDKDKKEKTLPEVPDIEGLAKAFRALSFKWIKGMQEQKVFPSKEELDDYYHTDAGREEPNLMTVLAGGAEYAKQLTERLLAVCAFFETPTVKKYGAGLLDVLKDKGVSQQLMPYVLKQLENEKYSAGSLAELIDPNYLPQRKQSILDLAIAQAKKEQMKGIEILPIYRRLALPSSPCMRNLTTPILAARFHAGQEIGVVFIISGKPELATDAPVKLIDLFYNEFHKSEQDVIYLKISDIEKATKIELRNQKGTKNKLSKAEARMQFVTKIRELCACLYGFFPEDTKAYSVIEYTATPIDSDYIGLKSEFFKKAKELQKGNWKLNLHNFFLTSKALSIKSDYIYELLKQYTNFLLESGMPFEVSISWQTLIDRCPQTKYYIGKLSTADKNKFLKRSHAALFVPSKTPTGKDRLPIVLNEEYCLLGTYYKDAKIIARVCPTSTTTRTAKITFCHKGRTAKTDAEADADAS